MRTIFSTDETAPKLRFSLWREVMRERLGPLKQIQTEDGAFESRIEVAEIGHRPVIRTSESCVRTEAPAGMPRRREGSETVFVSIQLAGWSACVSDGRESTQKPGEIVLLAERPAVIESGRDSQKLIIQMEAEALERLLGPTRQYTALTLDADHGTTELTITFFKELVRINQKLDAETAARMMGIGNDLVIASVAARLSRETPKTLHGNIVVQRAKAYIEANLGDHLLDPSTVAAATGVSVRRLQELFQDRGQHVSDWIWERRLAVAAERLANPQFSYMPIGMVAFGCGFKTLSHFSRRFKTRYGHTPRDYSRGDR